MRLCVRYTHMLYMYNLGTAPNVQNAELARNRVLRARVRRECVRVHATTWTTMVHAPAPRDHHARAAPRRRRRCAPCVVNFVE